MSLISTRAAVVSDCNVCRILVFLNVIFISFLVILFVIRSMFFVKTKHCFLYNVRASYALYKNNFVTVLGDI